MTSAIQFYEQLLWLDIEASGLHATSFPIEIGICGIDLEPRSFLIKPIEGIWTQADWSVVSEGFHKIPFENLIENGVDATQVARLLNVATDGKRIFSDNIEPDNHWLNRLYTDTGIRPTFELENARSLQAMAQTISPLSDADLKDVLTRVLNAFPHPHRAGPDARRNAALFLATTCPDDLEKILSRA